MVLQNYGSVNMWPSRASDSEANTLGEMLSAILEFSSEDARLVAYRYHYEKLRTQSEGTSDIKPLGLCIKLLPSITESHRHSHYVSELVHLILNRLPNYIHDPKQACKLAELCLSSSSIRSGVHEELVHCLDASADIPKPQSETMSSQDELGAAEKRLLESAAAGLQFLRYSYLLPASQNPYINLDLYLLFVRLLGHEALDEQAHNTLASLLTLLAEESGATPYDEENAQVDSTSSVIAADSITKFDARAIQESLFDRFQVMSSNYFMQNGGIVYRTWFLWMLLAKAKVIKSVALLHHGYWARVLTGLTTGFSDQRRYCLGILQASLELAPADIALENMELEIANREEYVHQYAAFCTVYETIVLNRYANQVQACLPDLTTMVGSTSVVALSFTIALLTAALDHNIQDGIRKIIGAWVAEYLIQHTGETAILDDFFVKAFLPWVTQGSLFTGSIIATRDAISCRHGSMLTLVVNRFVSASCRKNATPSIVTRILDFIANSDCKNSAPATFFLLKGLLDGVRGNNVAFNSSQASLLIRISQTPSFAEIAAKLCVELCCILAEKIETKALHPMLQAGLRALYEHRRRLTSHGMSTMAVSSLALLEDCSGDSRISVSAFLTKVDNTRYSILHGTGFVSACKDLYLALNEEYQGNATSTSSVELSRMLYVLGEEADRQGYSRSVILNLPTVCMHPRLIAACCVQPSDVHTSTLQEQLRIMNSKLYRCCQGRAYILPVVTTSLRYACFRLSTAPELLAAGEFLVQLFGDPPTISSQILFELIASRILEQHMPEHSYSSYYGHREWHGYAAILDLLARLPESQVDFATKVMDRILQPWAMQQAPVPVISKWKNVLQLQALLLLGEVCVQDSNVNGYLKGLEHALLLEQWPRYRFLLEWLIARIYHRYPNRAFDIFDKLAAADENSPVHIASLLKLGSLAAPFLNSEDFGLRLMIQLIPFSTSPKVQIRHEAQWLLPNLFQLAEEKRWETITKNPAFVAINKYIRSLDKFTTLPLTLRTLKLDAVADFTMANIFQGRYMTLEMPETIRVAHEDFIALHARDKQDHPDMILPPLRIPLGEPVPSASSATTTSASKSTTPIQPTEPPELPSAFLQTKSTFDLSNLIPSIPASERPQRPSPTLLVASLITNPTNLGGLSRIAESFGLSALYMSDVKKTLAHKDFKATSVTSEKHLPIKELGIKHIAHFVTERKREGYVVVGVEQTDRSGILGAEDVEEKQGSPEASDDDAVVKGTMAWRGKGKQSGKLPYKCVLVLGSERGGISSEVLAVVDRCVEIKTVGVTRSLNVQTAAGIVAYEWWRAWGEKRG